MITCIKNFCFQQTVLWPSVQNTDFGLEKKKPICSHLSVQSVLIVSKETKVGLPCTINSKGSDAGT